MSKTADQAKQSVDFEILGIGLVDLVICTRLPIEEAVSRANIEHPSGVSHAWFFDGEAKNQSPCPDGQGKTHYRLFC